MLLKGKFLGEFNILWVLPLFHALDLASKENFQWLGGAGILKLLKKQFGGIHWMQPHESRVKYLLVLLQRFPSRISGMNLKENGPDVRICSNSFSYFTGHV